MNQPHYQQLLAKLERLQREKIKDESLTRTKSRKKQRQGVSPPTKICEIKPNPNPILTDRQRIRSLGSTKQRPGKPILKGLTYNQFEIIKTLGAGTFGRVKLAKLKGEMEPLAIKVIPKSLVIQLKQVEHIKLQRKILSELQHPFIYSLRSAFQDELYVYMVFQFCSGGELFNRLRKDGRFSNDISLFYSTEILLALSHMHEQSVVYRDLKPENLLIDKDGHIKIADFGFAKKLRDREKTYTLCGTPEYLAPEIIHGSREGYGKSADWWAFGVLVYQLLTGHPPFYDLKPLGIYQKILKGIIEFPNFIKPRGKDLIRKLLNPEIRFRLGHEDNGTSIKEHKWFKGVDWSLVQKRQIPAPWMPPLRSLVDSSCFEAVPETPRNHAQPIPQEQQRLFDDFC